MAISAATIIRASFQDCGLVAENETLEAAQAQDGLSRLNNMVASWRTQFGTVLAIERMLFPLTANRQTYSIGLGGDFNVPRPVNSIPGAGLLLNGLAAAQTVSGITRSGLVATVTQTTHGLAVGDEVLIQGADAIDYNGLQTVVTVPTVSTYTYALDTTPVSPATGTMTAAAIQGEPVEIPIPVITDDMYQHIQLKNMPNAQFTNLYYNPSPGPLGQITLWPKPNTTINQLVLYLQNAFMGFADLTTAYDYPELPGYAEALQYNLDVRLFTPYGVKDGAILGPLREMATESLMLIKRANNKLVDLQNDARMLTADPHGWYNINGRQLMAGPSRVAINQELFFAPDSATQHSFAYFPATVNPYFDRLTVYILFSAGTTAGKVQLQSAPYHDYPGSSVWANEGSEIAWAVASSTVALHIDGIYGALRLDISTAVANGTIRAWVIGEQTA